MNNEEENTETVNNFGNGHPSESSPLNIQYFVEISCAKKVGRKKPLTFYYNNQKLGKFSDLIQEGSLKCPHVKSITRDVIQIECGEGDDCYTENINVGSISWRSGKNISLLNGKIPLHLGLRSKAQPVPSLDSLDLLDASVIAKNLLHIM